MQTTHPTPSIAFQRGDLVTIAHGPLPLLPPGAALPDTPLGLVTDVHADNGAVCVDWILPCETEAKYWMNPAVLKQASDD